MNYRELAGLSTSLSFSFARERSGGRAAEHSYGMADESHCEVGHDGL